jgi:5-methyltetrahydrofolate--homocysteine methyltransferase
MLIIAERINSTRKNIAPAVKNRDTAFIQNEAKKQAEAGGHFIDCNAATVGPEAEPDALCWLVKVVQEVVDLPISLDSPNPKAIEAAIKVHRGTPLINSITGERERMERLLPVILEHKPKVMALCMDDRGMPQSAQDRIEAGGKLVDLLLSKGVKEEDLVIDPLICPISTDSNHGNHVLDALRHFRKRYPAAKLSIGLTNVSFGLPERKWLNRSMLLLAMDAGLDAAILDPTDAELMALLLAGEALLGRDEMCINYISAAREGKLPGRPKAA